MKKTKQPEIPQPTPININTELKWGGPTNHLWMTLNKEQAKVLIHNYECSRFLNRVPAKNTISRYAQDMNTGHWENIDLAPVLIDKNGILRGGLHRMKAFVISNQDEMTFPTIYPASDKEIERQDTNRNRTAINKNDMVMSRQTYDEIQTMGNLLKSTIHTAAKILCVADDHPGLTPKNKLKAATDAEKRSYASSEQDCVKTIEKYLPIFKDIDAHGFPYGNAPVPGSINCGRFAPFVAAFAKTYSIMNRTIWKSFVGLLTEQVNPFNAVAENNKWLAVERLFEVIQTRTKQKNPCDNDRDMRRALSCLAAVHKDVSIDTVDEETFGYEVFLKKTP